MSHMFEVSRDSEYDISKEWHDINQIAYDGQNESKQSPSLNKSSFDRFASRLLNKLETSKSILTNFVTEKSLVQQSTPRNGTTSGNMEAPVIFGESDTRNQIVFKQLVAKKDRQRMYITSNDNDDGGLKTDQIDARIDKEKQLVAIQDIQTKGTIQTLKGVEQVPVERHQSLFHGQRHDE